MLESENKRNSGKDMADMALSATFVPDIPKDIIFPEELNTYLRDQIQYLTHENGMLKRNLSEYEVKLKEHQQEFQTLTKQVKLYEEAAPGNNFASISNIASAKIVELSKKLREKSSELETTKTKCSKLEQQIRCLEEKCDTPTTETATSLESQKPQSLPIAPDELKQLQDKLSTTNGRLFDVKNANAQLKNDLKLANKILQQEVGETFENLQSLINSGPSWRGRAQIIFDLQQKNNELREKLKSYSDKGSKQDANQPKPDRRLENLSKENIALTAENQDLKKKLETGKARLKVFESENSVLKTKMAMFTEQQDNDRQLISTLTGQLSMIRNVQSEDDKKKDQTLVKLHKDCKELKAEITKQKCRAENFEKEVQDKIVQINNLKSGTTSRGSRPPSGIPPKPIDEKLLNRLEAERIRLLELTKIANERLDNERKAIVNMQLQLKTERQKNARLESRIARLELDKCDRSSAYSFSTNKGKDKELTMKDRLELAEENIKALRTRLEMEQKEREIDFQEFSKILQNYTPSGDK